MSQFTFIVFTDSHITRGSNDGIWWNTMLRSRCREILGVAVEDANALAPDFVVHLGDLTDDSKAESFEAAAEILSGLNCPLHWVPGNHDTYIPGSRELAAKLLGVPAPPMYRAVQVGDWRLIFIDSAHWIYKDRSVHEYFDVDRYLDVYVPDAEIDWLRAELDRQPNTPTLCFSHVLLSVRDDYPISQWPDGMPAGDNPRDLSPMLCHDETKLKPLLESYPCVKAFFCGHGHLHDCFVDNGIFHCQTGALVSYPNEIRKVKVASDRIEVEVLPLSRGDFAEQSYVPERGNRFTTGRPEDRQYSHHL